MHTRNPSSFLQRLPYHVTSRLRGIGWLSLLMAASVAGHADTVKAGQPGGIDLELTDRYLTELRGWGLMPAPFDRQLPAYADGSPAHGDAGWLPNPRLDAVTSWIGNSYGGGKSWVQHHFVVTVKPPRSARRGTAPENQQAIINEN